MKSMLLRCESNHKGLKLEEFEGFKLIAWFSRNSSEFYKLKRSSHLFRIPQAFIFNPLNLSGLSHCDLIRFIKVSGSQTHLYFS